MLEEIPPDDSLEYEGEAAGDVRPEQLPGLLELTQLQNITPLLDDEQRAQISQCILEGLQIDEASREDWLERAQRGAGLASQTEREKSEAWQSNAMHPILTQAAMQFNARSLPAILPDGDIVKVAVHGGDESGEKAARAGRVAKFMSYQLRSKVKGWKIDMDSLLARLPVEGHLFRKIYYDLPEGAAAAKLYSPAQIVVNENSESIDRAPRISEYMELYPDEIEGRIRMGLYEEFDYSLAVTGSDGETSVIEDKAAPHTFVQQYLRYDLDGDGYPEPYIGVVHKESQKLVRLIANFTEQTIRSVPQTDQRSGEVRLDEMGEPIMKVVSIAPETFFVDYKFFPSLDGGYHGVGLAHLLGNNIELINGILNMLLDTGQMSSFGGGFIGNEINLGKGPVRFAPREWKQINASGVDLRQAIVQLDIPQPSPVLFQLLGLLIESAKEVATINNVMTGENPPANQPAATTLALIEQGMQVFNAAFSRIYNSLVKEFEILARINAQTLDMQTYMAFHDLRQDPKEMQAQASQGGQPMQQGMAPQMMGHNGGPALDPATEFDLTDMDIEPVANPRAVTSIQEIAKAQTLMELAAQGMVNQQEAVKRMLRAAAFEDIEDLLPTPSPEEQQMMAMEQDALKKLQMRGMEAEVSKAESEAVEKQSSAKLKEAQTLKTIADADNAEEGQDLEKAQMQTEAVMKQRELDQRDEELAIKRLDLIEKRRDNAARRTIERMARVSGNRSGSGGS